MTTSRQVGNNLGSKTAKGLRKNVTKDFGPFLSMGFQLAAGVVGFFFIGYWLDGKFGTSPWCSLGGAMLGAAGGLTKFIREAMALGKKADNEFEATHRSSQSVGEETDKQKREAR